MRDADRENPEKLVAFEPVLLVILFMLCMTAFHSVQFPALQITLVLLLVLAGLVLNCGFAFDASRQVRHESESKFAGPQSTGDRPRSFLVTALQVTPVIILFTGLIWLVIPLWAPENLVAPDTQTAGVAVWPVLKAALLSILIVIGGMFALGMLGMMMLGMALVLSDAKPAEEDVRVRMFQEMFLAGTMAAVFRPSDLEQHH